MKSSKCSTIDYSVTSTSDSDVARQQKHIDIHLEIDEIDTVIERLKRLIDKIVDTPEPDSDKCLNTNYPSLEIFLSDSAGRLRDKKSTLLMLIDEIEGRLF